jgi:hypothetical protein
VTFRFGSCTNLSTLLCQPGDLPQTFNADINAKCATMHTTSTTTPRLMLKDIKRAFDRAERTHRERTFRISDTSRPVEIKSFEA